MGGIGQQKTALGIARARFMEALPRKAQELKGAVATLVASPDVRRLTDEMRRRLHALYASAQVFQEQALASAVKQAIDRLDRARDAHRALNQEDLDTLSNLASALPTLGAPQKGVASIKPRASLSIPSTGGPSSSVTASGAPPGADATGGFLDSSVLVTSPPPAAPPPTPAAQQGAAPVGQAASEEQPAPAEPGEESPLPDDGRELLEQQAVVSVLVVGDPEMQSQVRAALPPERFEVLTASDAEEALRLARSSSPDLVVAERGIVLQPGVDIIGRLRNDPLTDFVPVVLALPEGAPDDPVALRDMGADDAVSLPIDGDAFVRTLSRLMEKPGQLGSALDDLTEATVDEIANRVTEEIKRGLTGSLHTGRNQRVSLGDKSEILAATWSAIGRIRTHVSRRSGSAVRFHDAPLRGGPAVLALVDGDSGIDESITGTLQGRKILVADDDPSVLWVFSGLFKEAGATVFEAADGRQALEVARRTRPDVVISDILMPEVDGFTLCKELKGDVVLADVPVILISWKEDFLQRMRELDAGASGYLRKEDGSYQILGSVHDVLRPRVWLEAQLRTGGEVRGRVEGLGTRVLLETVAEGRPDARVTVRDARTIFEADIRRGNLVAVTQTASDGSFVRGEPALLRLLGAQSGRFAVAECDAPVRSLFDAPLKLLLRETANKLGALVDAVSHTHLMQVEKVAFDEDLVESILEATPKTAREIVARLRQGQCPREMVTEGSVGAQQIELHLEDLARRGAISQVLGSGDEDLVAKALRIREESPGTLLHSTPPALGEVSGEDWLLDAQAMQPDELGDPGADAPAPPTEESADAHASGASGAEGPDVQQRQSEEEPVGSIESALASIPAGIEEEADGSGSEAQIHLGPRSARPESRPAGAEADIWEDVDRESSAALEGAPEEAQGPEAGEPEAAEGQLPERAERSGEPEADIDLRLAETDEESPGATDAPEKTRDTASAASLEQEPLAAEKKSPDDSHALGARDGEILAAVEKALDAAHLASGDAVEAQDGETSVAGEEAADATQAPSEDAPSGAGEQETPVAVEMAADETQAPPEDAPSGAGEQETPVAVEMAADETQAPPEDAPKVGDQERETPVEAEKAEDAAQATSEDAPQATSEDAPSGASSGASSDEEEVDLQGLSDSPSGQATSVASASVPPKASPSGWPHESASSAPALPNLSGLSFQTSPPPPARAARDQRRGMGLTLLIAAMFALGFVGWKVMGGRSGSSHEKPGPGAESSGPSQAPGPQTPGPDQPQGPADTAADGAVRADDGPPSQPPASTNAEGDDEPGDAAGDDEPGFGRVLNYIDKAPGVKVKPGQGLLVVEWDSSGRPPLVRLDERNLGRAPVALGLAPGRHELMFERPNGSSFRYVVVRAGQTRIVKTPQ